MASFAYYVAHKNLMNGGLDLLVDTLKVLLVESGTDLDTDKDNEFLDEWTLDETAAAGYSRQTVGTKAVNNAGPPFSATTYFDAGDVTFSSIGTGESIQAAVLYKHVTDDTDSFPIAYFDGDFPVTVNGGDLLIQWHANGLLSLA